MIPLAPRPARGNDGGGNALPQLPSVRRSSVALFLFFLLVLPLPAPPARGADLAAVMAHGFSGGDGGRYFAFEQFGVREPEGFPYAEYFVLDTRRDVWAKGAPVRVRAQGAERTLAQVRAEARKRAAPLLRRYRISHAGRLVAFNPLTELSAAPHEVRFTLSAENPVPWLSFTLKMQTYPVSGPACAPEAGKARGFSLTLTSLNGAMKKRLHRDDPRKGLPKSRGCARDYRITHVYHGETQDGNDALVILVEVFSRAADGGRNGRFIAIPARLALGG